MFLVFYPTNNYLDACVNFFIEKLIGFVKWNGEIRRNSLAEGICLSHFGTILMFMLKNTFINVVKIFDGLLAFYLILYLLGGFALKILDLQKTNASLKKFEEHAAVIINFKFHIQFVF